MKRYRMIEFVGGMKPHTSLAMELWCGRIDWNFAPRREGSRAHLGESCVEPVQLPYRSGAIHLGNGSYLHTHKHPRAAE